MPRFLPSLLFFIFLLVSSRKLTTEENEQNRKNCGVHFLGGEEDNRISKRSYGRRNFKENEYPWTVIIKLTDSGNWCSGALISERHVLTAAHCMLKMNDTYNNEQCKSNGNYDVLSATRDPEEISVYLSSNITDCNDVGECLHYNPAQITVHDFKFCDLYNDLALIELSENVPETLATPICMPSENLQLDNALHAAGYGSEDDQSSRVPQVVAQKLYGVDEPSHKIMTRTFARAISREGSGGPLFQMVEGSHTLAGINIDGDAWRPKADFGENFKAQYVDVRAYLDWICKFSGVCPIEDDSNGEQSTDASNSTRKNSKNNIKS